MSDVKARSFVDVPHPKQVPTQASGLLRVSEDAMTEKRCARCGETKPLGMFSRNRTKKDGMQTFCKECSRQCSAQSRLKHKEKTSASRAVYRANHKKERGAYRAAHREEISAREKAYNIAHKEEIAGYRLEYRATHKEHINARNAAYRASHREERATYQRQYYREHTADRIAYAARYGATERGRAYKAVSFHRRRAALSGIPLTTDTILEVKAASMGICPYCCDQIIKGHIDHIVPVSGGGTNARENLVYVCATCNISKGKKSLLEFILFVSSEMELKVKGADDD